MGCKSCGPGKKKKVTFVCSACGKEEIKEVKAGEKVKSCCGKAMREKK